MHTLENFFFICNSGKKQPLCRRCPSRQTPVKAFQSLFNGLHAPFEEPGFHQGSNYNTHHIVEEPISLQQDFKLRAVPAYINSVDCSHRRFLCLFE